MRKASGGYTIIEAMIVLAVSATLFVAAIIIFSGRQGSEEFRQSMQDLSSKVQGYVNGASSGVFAENQNYDCTVSTRPQLKAGSNNGIGTRQECVFLGYALRTSADESSIHAYTVLGDRTNPNSGAPASSLNVGAADFLYPEPAVDNSGKLILVEDYNLLFGNKIVSSKISNASGHYELIGFYDSFGTGSVPASGASSASIDTWAYNLDGPKDPSSIKACIEQSGAPCSPSLQSVSEWDLCIQNTGSGPPYGQLVVTNSGGSVNTRINYLNSSCA